MCLFLWSSVDFLFFFFNDTATTEIYTLSLHDALPISCTMSRPLQPGLGLLRRLRPPDRKSTRLNSSHQLISYAVFCLKKKQNQKKVFGLQPDQQRKIRNTLNRQYR